MVTLARSVSLWENENFVLRSLSRDVAHIYPRFWEYLFSRRELSLGGFKFKCFITPEVCWSKQPLPPGFYSHYGATAAGVAMNRTPKARPIVVAMTTTVLSGWSAA